MRKLSVLFVLTLMISVVAPAEASRPGDAATRILCRTQNDQPNLRFDDGAGPVLISETREFQLGAFFDLLNAVPYRMKLEQLWPTLDGAPPLLRFVYKPATVPVGEPLIPFIATLAPVKLSHKEVRNMIFNGYTVCVDGICFDDSRLDRFRIKLATDQCLAFAGQEDCWLYGYNYVLEFNEPGTHVIEQTVIDAFEGEESVLRFEWTLTTE